MNPAQIRRYNLKILITLPHTSVLTLRICKDQRGLQNPRVAPVNNPLGVRHHVASLINGRPGHQAIMNCGLRGQNIAPCHHRTHTQVGHKRPTVSNGRVKRRVHAQQIESRILIGGKELLLEVIRLLRLLRDRNQPKRVLYWGVGYRLCGKVGHYSED